MVLEMGGERHTLFVTPKYYRYLRYVTIAATSSYSCQIDFIEMPFYRGTKTTIGISVVAIVTDLWRHLTYKLRGAWHRVYVDAQRRVFTAMVTNC